jgi:hypothetical protein
MRSEVQAVRQSLEIKSRAHHAQEKAHFKEPYALFTYRLLHHLVNLNVTGFKVNLGNYLFF